VSCAVMGFDWRMLKMLAGAFAVKCKPLVTFSRDDIEVVSNEPSKNKSLKEFGASG